MRNHTRINTEQEVRTPVEEIEKIIPTCRSCHKPLKRFIHHWTGACDMPIPKVGEKLYGQDILEVVANEKAGGSLFISADVWTGKYGYGGSSHFCTMRCGYQLGAAMAKKGWQLQKEQTLPEPDGSRY